MDQGTRALIRRHNDYVRDQVVRDLDALGDKLNVKRQVEGAAHDAVDKVKGKLGMNQDAHGVAGFLRANVIPLAAVGLGGALLARNARQNLQQETHVSGTATLDSSGAAGGGTAERIQHKGEEFKEKGQELKADAESKLQDAKLAITEKRATLEDRAAEMKQAVSSSVESVQGTIGNVGSSVADAVPSQQQVKTVVRENASLVGVAAMAAGVLAGAFLPRTRIEQRKLAPLQEQIADRAQEVVDQGVDRAKNAFEAGKEAAGSELGLDEGGGDDSSGSATVPVTTPNRITSSAGGSSAVDPGVGSKGTTSGSGGGATR